MTITAFPSQPIVGLDEATSLTTLQRQLRFANLAPFRNKRKIMLEAQRQQDRITALRNELSYLSQALDEFEVLAVSYVQQHELPLAGSSDLDADGLLAWLAETQDLSPEHRDIVDLQRARNVIQRRWQQFQPAVRRYHALCQSTASQRLMQEDSTMRVHLNPLRAWSRVRTSELLTCDVPAPATILLFAVGDVFATRVFGFEGQTLLNELADYQPCTLDQWSALSALANREQLLAFCQELSELGLVCFS